MKKMILAALATMMFISSQANADVITQWNFNGDSATTVPGGATSPSTSIGTGTASLLGGTTATFASGIAQGGSSDPVNTAPPNYGWNLTNFAAQGAENNFRGAQFLVSTLGFENIVVSWDNRNSNTSSAFQRFLYTLDGGSNWIDDGIVFQSTSGDTWFNGRSVDLTSVGGANNNTNFGFQLVATFDPNGTGYVAANATSNYASGGTWRLDMVTVSSIPEPGSIAVLALVAATAIGRRRRV